MPGGSGTCVTARGLAALARGPGRRGQRYLGAVRKCARRRNDAERHHRRENRMIRSAVYPGTFDPLPNGHQDLVRRAACLYDRVVVAVAANANKAPLFPLEARVDMARRVLADLANVEVMGYGGLTVDFARQQGIKVVLRGRS